ncbi:MAG: hypothetical protein J3R72DRAFT_417412 [Linnemannia gamsii]|nr:MAG: hypothetical protein J3R72DRAFT_417412 [Linnemannia gamsii]
MEITTFLILVTAITAVVTTGCIYDRGYSLLWAYIIPAPALVIWVLYEIYQKKSKVVFSAFLLMLGVFACFCGVSPWILGIPIGSIVLWIAVYSDLLPQDRNERHNRATAHTYSVPSYQGRPIDERASLLPAYSRLPTETPSRVASSQSSYTSRSSFGDTPRVLHTAPDSSFRVIVDPGFLRYSTPTVAVDPRLQHYTTQYTTPTVPSPAVVETRHTFHSNRTSSSFMIAAERKLDISATVARQEIDGLYLHAALSAEVDDRYSYDQQIETDTNPYSAKRTVKGYFKCYSCKQKHLPGEPRTWMSNGICVEIWMSSSGRRYRTRLHSQMCANCNRAVEPDVIKEDYVPVVVEVLDRWTGQTSVVKPRPKYFKTGPHRTDKCSACLRGVCPAKPAE